MCKHAQRDICINVGFSFSTALLYSVFGVAIEKARGAEDDLNTVAAGTLTGMLFKSTSEEKSHWLKC